MDLRIAKAMKEAANVVFTAMEIKQDVNITTMQVYEHFTNGRKNVAGMPKDMEFIKNIPVCSGEGWEIGADAEITINIDSYSCKLFGIAIFQYLNTFERIAGVKDRARFIYSVPASSSAVTLNITVAKNAKEILCHAADELRPAMNGVYIDMVNNNIVASDGHTLQVMRCYISGVKPDINGVLIPAEIAKRAFAKREFTLTIDGDRITCNNESYDMPGRYPNYLTVWRSFSSSDAELIQLMPNTWKEITTKAKTALKQYNRVVFVFHALSGNNYITVDVWDNYEGKKVNEFTINTAAAVPESFGVGIFAEMLLRFKGVDRFQGLDSGRAVVMYGADYIGLAMPGNI
jgi:hypothetical protein